MIETIYSKKNPTLLLHCIHRLNEEYGRKNIIPEKEFLQCSFLKFNDGQTFKPHKHIYKTRLYYDQIAQESWIVIKGKVECIFYDIDDSIISNVILNPGDASFTLRGGHNYKILEEGTIVYEYKTGPYEGIEMDKTFI